MSSQLHARRKIHEVIARPPDSGSPDKRHSSNRRDCGLKRIPSELRWAVTAVMGFIFIGVFLSYLLLHHQHRQVIVHVLQDPWNHGPAALRGRAGFRHHFYSGSPRFVTVVMPSVVNGKGRRKRLNSIQDTWGPYARAIYVVHNVTEFPQASPHAVISNASSPEDPYSYPQIMLIPPEIGVENGVPRLYHTIRTVYEKVNPDFAFFVNDHTFVIPEHLCKYLERRDPEDDLYAGHALKNGKSDVFNSGAAGYLMSRATMHKMIQKWNVNDPNCLLGSDKASSWLQGNPGLVTVKCLQSMNINAIDTRGGLKWHRFHAFPLTRVVAGKVDEWYLNKHDGVSALAGFDKSYDKLLFNQDCCSKDTISFHYVEWKESLALFAVREALLTDPHMTNHELKSMMIKEWPRDPKEIGSYSQGLPDDKDEKGWFSLLSVTRKISTRATQRDC